MQRLICQEKIRSWLAEESNFQRHLPQELPYVRSQEIEHIDQASSSLFTHLMKNIYRIANMLCPYKTLKILWKLQNGRLTKADQQITKNTRSIEVFHLSGINIWRKQSKLLQFCFKLMYPISTWI